MTDAKQQLRVGYEGWDTELESELIELLGKHGYECHTSGYDLIGDRRDLYFDRAAREGETIDEDDECP